MADERDRSIWAQNAGTTAAVLLGAYLTDELRGGDLAEFLATYDVIRAHVFNGTVELTGLAIVQDVFNGAVPVAAPAAAVVPAVPAVPVGGNVVPLVPPVPQVPPPAAPTPPPAVPASNVSGMYLNVPMQQKDAAKALGAKWDPNAKKWYVPAGIDPSPFALWFN